MSTDTSPEDAQDQALRLADALDGGKLIDDSTEWADTLHAAAEMLRSLHIEATEQARLLGISAEREMALRARVRELEAARIAYASEFELNADGEPDVGSIHANIRALKSQLSAPHQCLHGISEPSGWVSVNERLPEPGKAVLLDIGKKMPIRAMWAAKHTVEAHDEADPGWCDYDETTGMYYCPEGWYEWNQHEEVHWAVSEKPRAWMPMPSPSSAY